MRQPVLPSHASEPIGALRSQQVVLDAAAPKDGLRSLDVSPSLAPPSMERLAALDAARVFATFGIIWTHVTELQGFGYGESALGRFGTSFYVIVAMLFVVRGAVHSPDRPLGDDIKKKAQRLLKPYVVWSLVYAVFYGQRAYFEGGTLSGLTMWWGPVAGTAVHLWFLPFVFFWGVLCAWLTPKLFRVKEGLLLPLGLFVSAGTSYFCLRWLFFAIDRDWLWKWHLHRLDRWIDEIPLVVISLFVAVGFHRSKQSARDFLNRHLASIALVSAFGFVATEYVYFRHIDFIRDSSQTDGRFVANLAGWCLLAAFLALGHTRAVQKLSGLGRYTYLAFLSHMVVLEILQVYLKKLPTYGSVPTAFATAALVLAGSLLISRVIAHTPKLRLLRP